MPVPGRLLAAHGRSHDVYAAVDEAETMLEREVDRWRERLIDRRG